MRHASKWPLPALSLFAALLPAGEALAQMPNAIGAPDEAIVVTLHAQGAQNECKAAGGGKLSWTFREPIATLLLDGSPRARRGQSVQAAAIRQGQRDAGQERSARCADDRIIRRHHADATGAAADADDRTARRDAYRPAPALLAAIVE